MYSSWTRLLASTAIATFACAFSGCGGSEFNLVPVTGKVTFADPAVLQAEIKTINFVPKELGGGGKGGKAANGNIQDDGTFKLMTMVPDDGAFPGDYRVEIHVFKTYRGREVMIDPKYDKAGTTPLTATIKEGDKNHFEFTVEKK